MELVRDLQNGVAELFESDRYQEYLKTMARFHHYSVNNVLMILNQKPDATLVAGYQAWSSMKRYVKKGERGIQIIVPYSYTKKTDDGQEETVQSFRYGYVFDISQTDGQPIPQLTTRELEDSVPDFWKVFDYLCRLAECPVHFRELHSGCKGLYVLGNDTIFLQENLSEAQTLKTLTHELAHRRLHRNPGSQKSREAMEMEAESIAYVVCAHMGIDTSGYSFPYMLSWTKERTNEELLQSMGDISRAADSLIQEMDALNRSPDQPDRTCLYRYYALSREKDHTIEYPRIQDNMPLIRELMEPEQFDGEVYLLGYVEYRKPLTEEQMKNFHLIDEETRSKKKGEKNYALQHEKEERKRERIQTGYGRECMGEPDCPSIYPGSGQ